MKQIVHSVVVRSSLTRVVCCRRARVGAGVRCRRVAQRGHAGSDPVTALEAEFRTLAHALPPSGAVGFLRYDVDDDRADHVDGLLRGAVRAGAATGREADRSGIPDRGARRLASRCRRSARRLRARRELERGLPRLPEAREVMREVAGLADPGMRDRRLPASTPAARLDAALRCDASACSSRSRSALASASPPSLPLALIVIGIAPTTRAFVLADVAIWVSVAALGWWMRHGDKQSRSRKPRAESPEPRAESREPRAESLEPGRLDRARGIWRDGDRRSCLGRRRRSLACASWRLGRLGDLEPARAISVSRWRERRVARRSLRSSGRSLTTRCCCRHRSLACGRMPDTSRRWARLSSRWSSGSPAWRWS